MQQYIKSITNQFRDYDGQKVNVFIINDRYEIHTDFGVCYDTIKGGDLPQYIFRLRESLTNNRFYL